MNLNPKYLTVGAAVAVTAVTAHLMQSNRSGQTPSGGVQVASMAVAAAPAVETPSQQTAPVRTGNEVTLVSAKPEQMPLNSESRVARSDDAVLPAPPQDALMPEPLPQMGADLQNRMLETAPVAPSAEAVTKPPLRNQFGLTCGAILTASPKDMAMVGLTLTAPCRGEQTVVIRHGDLEFSGVINHLGTYTVEVPALLPEAEFTATFEDGTDTFALAMVPDADQYERVALTYKGAAGLQIHALEFGADYDEDGHVWAGAARDVETATRVGGGYMTVLGDDRLEDPLMAQVYTFPGTGIDRDGVVRLSIEAEVTAFNCDTEASGQTIQRGAAGLVTPVSLTVSMPDCTAIGEYLVLKNLLRDLKIASN